MAQSSAEEMMWQVDQMRRSQPVLLAYLLASSEANFTRAEAEIVFYVGMVVWQIMQHSQAPLRRVTEKQIEEIEKVNDKFLDLLASSTETELEGAVLRLLQDHREPEVLRYIVEALIEESDDPDSPPLSEENRGLAFIILKNVLDALVESRESAHVAD